MFVVIDVMSIDFENIIDILSLTFIENSLFDGTVEITSGKKLNTTLESLQSPL